MQFGLTSGGDKVLRSTCLRNELWDWFCLSSWPHTDIGVVEPMTPTEVHTHALQPCHCMLCTDVNKSNAKEHLREEGGRVHLLKEHDGVKILARPLGKWCHFSSY